MTILASTAPSPSVLRDADAPFNDKKSSDMVLRSADKVNFHVHKIILSLASPYFKRRLSGVKQSTDASCVSSVAGDSVADRPVINVLEDAPTIDFILRCCYPIDKPRLTRLDKIRPALYAAQKYEMVAVAVAWVPKNALIDLINTHLLEVMNISVHCDLRDVFRMAFEQSLKIPSLLSLESDELDRLSGNQYYSLVLCHHHRTFTIDLFFHNIKTGKLTKSKPLRTTSPPRDAKFPFDDKNADVVLRSCDQIDFHVYKNILSITSSFFKDMFSLPQPSITPAPPPTTSDPVRHPIVDVAENANTLDFILRCAYPIDVPELQQNDVLSVLEAGQKYDIKSSTKAAEAAMFALMDKNALAAFALAVQSRMEHICAIAARRLLKQELMDTRSSSSSEVSYISARPIRKLLQYHQQCGEAAAAVVRSRDWLSDNFLGGIVLEGRSWGPCCVKDERSSWFAHQDVWDYVKEAEQTLPICPHSEAMLSPWWPIDVSCERYRCGRQSFGRDLSQALRSAVEAATAEDKIPIPTFC